MLLLITASSLASDFPALLLLNLCACSLMHVNFLIDCIPLRLISVYRRKCYASQVLICLAVSTTASASAPGLVAAPVIGFESKHLLET